MNSQGGAFYTSQNHSLGTAREADDYLHPDANSRCTADTATETQFFSFCVPAAKIHAYAYLWHHPTLKVVTGGLLVWRGTKATHVAAEICDFRHFLNEDVLKGNLHSYRLPNGYGVDVIEPLRRHRMTYADAARQNKVSLEFEALTAPAMFGDGLHFEQPMRVTGELILRGERFNVDCYTVRDRSWGKPRPEDNLPMPPYSWMSGVFGGDFSFNCGVFDQAAGNPEIAGRFEMPAERSLSGGWLYQNGRTGRLVRAAKRIVRDPILHRPIEIEIDITDDLERQRRIRGAPVASCPWVPWTNIFMTVSLMRWECDGRTAHGDCQEAIWNDYCREMFN